MPRSVYRLDERPYHISLHQYQRLPGDPQPGPLPPPVIKQTAGKAPSAEGGAAAAAAGKSEAAAGASQAAGEAVVKEPAGTAGAGERERGIALAAGGQRGHVVKAGSPTGPLHALPGATGWEEKAAAAVASGVVGRAGVEGGHGVFSTATHHSGSSIMHGGSAFEPAAAAAAAAEAVAGGGGGGGGGMSSMGQKAGERVMHTPQSKLQTATAAGGSGITWGSHRRVLNPRVVHIKRMASLDSDEDHSEGAMMAAAARVAGAGAAVPAMGESVGAGEKSSTAASTKKEAAGETVLGKGGVVTAAAGGTGGGVSVAVRYLSPPPEAIAAPGEAWGTGGRWIEPFDEREAQHTVEKLLSHWHG